MEKNGESNHQNGQYGYCMKIVGSVILFMIYGNFMAKLSHDKSNYQTISILI